MVFYGFRNLGQEFIIFSFLRCIHEYIYRIAILRLREETYRLSRSERIGMVSVAERIGVRERERERSEDHAFRLPRRIYCFIAYVGFGA